MTQARLKELLQYDPLTGVFTWLISGHGVKVGQIAGWQEKNGYARIRVDGRKYTRHRLAWLYTTGEWPKNQIDHKDLCKSNNIWTNLREADGDQNQHNVLKRVNNNTGFKGVHWVKDARLFRAMIQVDGKRIFLGYFKTAQAAGEVYKKAASEHHKEFARTE